MSKTRWIGALLCLCLLVAPLGAWAAPGDAMAFVQNTDPDAPRSEEEYYAEAVVRMGDVFFAKGNQAIYRWQDGMETAEKYCDLPAYPDAYWDTYEQAAPEVKTALDNIVSHIAAGDGKLWAINNFSGRVGEIAESGVKWSDVKLDITALQTVEGAEKRVRQRSLTNCFVMDGTLYCLRDNYSDENWTNNCVLLRFDLATGAQTSIETKCAQMVTPYKAGQLLAFGTMYDESIEAQISGLSVIDLASGAETALPYEMPLEDAYNLGGLAYDEASDTIYYYFQKQIWKSTAGEPFVAVAYLTQAYITEGALAWVLPSGLYALGSGGLFIRNVDPQYKSARVLRINGGWEDLGYMRFASKNPDIPVLFSNNWAGNAEAIAGEVTGGDTTTDIYILPAHQGLRDLIDKGFAADLSGSAILSQSIAAMYPQVQSALTNEQGKIMAYPRTLNVGPWSVNISLWERYDMGPLPTTFAQFFDYMQRWQDDFAEDNPDISFVEGSYDGSSLAEIVLHTYILQSEQPGKPIDFNSPALRQVLEQISKLELEEFNFEDMSEEDWEEYYEMTNRPSLFTMYSRNGMFYNPNTTQYVSSDPEQAKYYEYNEYQDLLPMVFEEGQTPYLRARMEVMIVNPASPNADLAQQYIEFFAQSGIDNYYRYALSPELNDPIERKDFAMEVKGMEEWLTSTKERLATAPESDKRNIQDEVDYIAKWLAEQDKNKWEISSAAIEGYRKWAPYMNFADNSVFFKQDSGGAMEMLREMLTRYIDGQLSLDAFLRELDSKMRMMVLEGQ